ncbi:SCP2 sterol-binding domain-containing protein [Nannocystis pusilla]|uniref:SCP2 sterol-binding domain-containing protein n=1 Tax=Nannocystis pusilla TaxID=889268 RepID=A0A9X3EYZ7_9BACT|nr:SCP2 sterol-binding domain-containing protein [Nannocystis pusilla]MCY1012862.1 SCP2 sterol-binding domain-containing protein [Nannocystis pusilla]
MNVQRFFNEDLPAALRRNPAGAAEIGGTYQFRISGPEGGEWWVEVTRTKTGVWPGYWPGAQCELAIDSADFKSLVTGDPNIADALATAGRLVVMGSQSLVARVGQLSRL